MTFKEGKCYKNSHDPSPEFATLEEFMLLIQIQ